MWGLQAYTTLPDIYSAGDGIKGLLCARLFVHILFAKMSWSIVIDTSTFKPLFVCYSLKCSLHYHIKHFISLQHQLSFLVNVLKKEIRLNLAVYTRVPKGQNTNHFNSD